MFTGFVAIFIFPTVKDGIINDTAKVTQSGSLLEHLKMKDEIGSLTVEY